MHSYFEISSAVNIILWFFNSIQFVGAMFEHNPSPFEPIQFVMVNDWPSNPDRMVGTGLEGAKRSKLIQKIDTGVGYPYNMASPKVKILHKMVSENHSVPALK